MLYKDIHYVSVNIPNDPFGLLSDADGRHSADVSAAVDGVAHGQP